MSWFLRRASLHIVNQSSIPTLVKKLRAVDQPNTESQSLVAMGGEDGAINFSQNPIDKLTQYTLAHLGTQQTHAEIIADRAQAVLDCMSKYHPAIYTPHVGELVKALADEKHPKLVQCCAQALAAVVRLDGSLAPTEK